MADAPAQFGLLKDRQHERDYGLCVAGHGFPPASAFQVHASIELGKECIVVWATAEDEVELVTYFVEIVENEKSYLVWEIRSHD